MRYKRKKLEIVKFINTHKDWQTVLSNAPYHLSIKTKDNYILLKYNQLFSDFNNSIVREARGLILKCVNGKYTIVCMPYTKFFNVGDPNAKADLCKLYHRKEWFIEEKIDGSLIKLWYDDGAWHISTSGTIDAKDAVVQSATENITYYDLFRKASTEKINYEHLDKQYTYLFELVGLENKVIVPYRNNDIYYLGRCNNYTLNEVPYYEDDCIGVEKCKRPKCVCEKVVQNPRAVMENIQNRANKLTEDDENFEGYVVADYSLKSRVKIKSSKYLELFKQKGNGIFTTRKILLMILDEKDDDIVSAFPEYKSSFDNVRRALSLWIEDVKTMLKYMDSHSWDNRKAFAEWAKGAFCPSIAFKAYSVDYWADGWLENCVKNINIDRLLEYIGFNEEKEGKDEDV